MKVLFCFDSTKLVQQPCDSVLRHETERVYFSCELCGFVDITAKMETDRAATARQKS